MRRTPTFPPPRTPLLRHGGCPATLHSPARPLHMLVRALRKFLGTWHERPSPRTPCTPHSGERHHPVPPLAVASPTRARKPLSQSPGGLRMPRSPSLTQTPVQNDPRSTDFSELRRAPRCATADRAAGVERRRPLARSRSQPHDLPRTHDIRSRVPFHPEPMDLDPMARNTRARVNPGG